MKGRNPRVAVIGCGYWGRNHVRNFSELGCLAAVCDLREDTLNWAREQYNVATVTNADSVFADEDIDAVVIAAPAAEHYLLAKCALASKKDVFVEKPLSLHSIQGKELVALAREQQRILMVGHVLEYHPAIKELRRLIQAGELGRIQYIYSSRLNLGKLRTEENILWSFAPHDISAVLLLLGEAPTRAASHGGSYLSPPIVDTTLTTLDFASGVKAHIFVSWLHPFKEQKLTVVGSQRMAVFDDVQAENKLVLYSHRINWRNRVPVAEKESGQVIPLPAVEPLRLECEHFVNAVSSRQRPQTDGESAVRVLEILEACERSLREKGTPVEVSVPKKPFFAHPTAVVDDPCEIGEGTKIWHFSHIMAGSKLGRNCNLGQNIVICPEVLIGNNVKIQNNVSVYTGVQLGDDVFCGPSMVFTNVINPRSHVVRRHEYKKTIVKQGATLGANCTVVCGTTIGRYAFVAAGAVVTSDVPDFGLVMGVPARLAGWMCRCGDRLPQGLGASGCVSCGQRYEISADGCSELGTMAQVATGPTHS
ncbi:MAG: Gfo/Idh/MocA family oxidoreductase [Candidatus Acidiferrum sp.]